MLADLLFSLLHLQPIIHTFLNVYFIINARLNLISDKNFQLYLQTRANFLTNHQFYFEDFSLISMSRQQIAD